jgi:hypothetical protein
MKYREIYSFASGENVVVGRVELDAPEDACRIVTEFPKLKEELENGIVGAGGYDPDIGFIRPDEGELFLDSLEFEFVSGFTRVSEVRGSFEE